MKYTHYKEEDFVKDTYFQKWILDPDRLTRNFWENWVLQHPHKKDTVENAARMIRLIQFAGKEELSATEIDTMWQNIFQKRKKKSNRNYFQLYPSSPFEIKSLLRFAALFTIVISTTFALYHLLFNSEQGNIEPMGSRITLKLEDGSVHVLKEQASEVIMNEKGNRIVNQERNTLVYDKKRVSDQQHIAYNELVVPYGKKFELRLSDGSHVFLNSGSKLRYPVAFSNNSARNVFLDGEAYFSVEKDKVWPFKVITNTMNTRVYGTKFNICGYGEEEETAVVLVEGSVGVYKTSNVSSHDDIKIVPGQRALMIKDDISIDEVNVNKHIAWTVGKLIFIDDPFETIVKILERHFNIAIDNQVAPLNKKRFTGTFTKESLDQILRVFQEHTPFDFRIKGSTITIREKEKS
ncbi:FecR family protein [uncultured Kriegella sp.]|uniref:FecR family protein n=1 Tax=uncultured Kriegella sp. TaxID=1798910 RepID=UPI0030DD88A0|tara:strand:+ start:102140 stop:103360 length:1221 start_codon:yes stop_codon:yes gene_type:complete